MTISLRFGLFSAGLSAAIVAVLLLVIPEPTKTRAFKLKSATHERNSEGLRLIFVIGIEGTGHHLLTHLIKDAPAKLWGDELGIGVRNMALVSLLLHKDDMSLFTSHCNFKPDRESSYPRIVNTLKSMASLLPPGETLNYNINVNDRLQKTGMGSYPNFQGDCRQLGYPNIDLLYKACNEARVKCAHVYLYRDPYAVLQSTVVNRDYSGDAISAMHLYTTMLQVIHAQLMRQSSRTLACLGLYDTQQSWEDRWRPIRDLYGWTNKTEFSKYLSTLFIPPTPLNETTKHTFTAHLDESLYMELFITLHNEVLQLCRNQVMENNPM